MKQIKAAAASWARSAMAGCLAVYMTGNTNPKDLAMGLIAGIVPVLARWANPNDPTFGIKK
jgi:hypothetical protein